MTAACDRETIHLSPNPRFLPNQPFSYESVLCRLAGWWTMGMATLTPREVITKRLTKALVLLVLCVGLGACQRPPKEPVCLTWITPCP